MSDTQTPVVCTPAMAMHLFGVCITATVEPMLAGWLRVLHITGIRQATTHSAVEYHPTSQHSISNQIFFNTMPDAGSCCVTHLRCAPL